MAFDQIKDNAGQLKEHTQEYVETTLSYHKLNLFRKAMKGLSQAAQYATIGAIFLISLVFASMGLAYYLSDILDSLFYGFFIVAALYFILFIVALFMIKRPLEKLILIKFSKLWFNDNDEIDDELEKMDDGLINHTDESLRQL